MLDHQQHVAVHVLKDSVAIVVMLHLVYQHRVQMGDHVQLMAQDLFVLVPLASRALHVRSLLVHQLPVKMVEPVQLMVRDTFVLAQMDFPVLTVK